METKGSIGFESSLPSGDHTNPADCAHRFGQFVAPLGRVHRGSVRWGHPGHKFAGTHFQSRHPHHDFHGKPCSQTNTTDRIVTGGPVCRKRPSKSGSLLSSNQIFRCKLAPPTPGVACDWQVSGEIQQLALMTKSALHFATPWLERGMSRDACHFGSSGSFHAAYHSVTGFRSTYLASDGR